MVEGEGRGGCGEGIWFFEVGIVDGVVFIGGLCFIF